VPEKISTPLFYTFTDFLGEFYTVKRGLAIFPSPGGMSLTKLSLAENEKIFPGQDEFG
jgi:hypothetical protein